MQRCFARGIAACLDPVIEEDVPSWLWRHAPDEAALAVRPERDRYCGESGLPQVVARIAGAWTYHGWKGGYFDSEQDARAFFDEIRWLLVQRRLSPSIAQWRTTGLHWAYGLSSGSDDSYITDYRTGIVRRAGEGDTPPRGSFINDVRDSLAGDGGIADLWRREAAILQGGAACGTNVSALAGSGSTGGDGRLTTLLSVGDAAALTAESDACRPGVQRRITIDAAHPGSRAAIQRSADSMIAAATRATGQALVRRHIDGIVRACRESRARRPADPRINPALRLAIQSARQAMLPDPLIDRTLRLMAQGEPLPAGFAADEPDAMPDRGTVTVIRAGDAMLEHAPEIIDGAAISAWTAGPAGLHYEDAAEAANTCRASGSIRAAAGDGGFMFLDDTACDHAVLNAAAYLLDDGTFDAEGFRHAAALLATALDISLMTAAQPTPRLASRVWEFRPIGMSLAGLGDLLMAMGIPYDSDEGRAIAGALGALMTGAAWLASARMAAEAGAFPGHAENAAAIQGAIRRHGDAAAALQGVDPALASAVREVWQAACDEGASAGFRNAQVSWIAEAAAECVLLGCASHGVAPVGSLVRFERLPAGGWRKTANPSVARGLRALGYGDPEIGAMLDHLAGRATLANAPGVNHETLRKRGFTDGAIASVEANLPTASDIRDAVNPWMLGETYCRRMLGLIASELEDESFDLLAELGFSEAGIEAARLYCCGAGTLEGAPHLDPAHLAVFDCAAPQGERGRRRVAWQAVVRMSAAVQPTISGAIGQTVVLPESATVADCRAALHLGRQLGLKSLTIRRADAPPVPASQAGLADMPAGSAPALSIVEEPQRPHTNIRTDIAEAGEHAVRDAETSRRAASHAARSAASVPSSADVAVEQRQV